jgi:hypothetical protein
MGSRRIVQLAALALIIGCVGDKSPTGVGPVPNDPSKIISDGAHGVDGNKDFFFLPPMVPLPINNPNFELGKFNNTLKSSLTVRICELRNEFLNAQGLPTGDTRCIAGDPIKTFAPGSIQLVNLPLRQNGWWTLFNLPPDGFYYVLWDTRQSNLNVSKYYRISVLIDGLDKPLGVADVDPMANLFQWKYSNTGQVIQLVDDVLLPIPFRVEKGGGSTLCGGATICASATIAGNSATTQESTMSPPALRSIPATRAWASSNSMAALPLPPRRRFPKARPQVGTSSSIRSLSWRASFFMTRLTHDISIRSCGHPGRTSRRTLWSA